jgi:cell division protein FtsB
MNRNLEQRSAAESALAELRARSGRRAWIRRLLAFATCVLVINALVGERGLIERRRAERDANRLAAELAALRRENTALRQRMQQLTHDPRAIEVVAREELGLARRGEVLVLLKSLPSR